MITNIEEANKRIKELEALNKVLKAENEKLKAELAVYDGKKPAGRKKHNESWMASYMDFEINYANGKTIMEIVDEGKISRRTAYRYKAYYDSLKKNL